MRCVFAHRGFGGCLGQEAGERGCHRDVTGDGVPVWTKGRAGVRVSELLRAGRSSS